MGHLSFSRTGSGKPIILLHGFPFNKTIWQSFAEKLSKSIEVYTVDLPGLGESLPLKEPFTIESAANEILKWIKENKIEKSTVIGHSLGGYVALAMVKKEPDKFDKLGLFHSTAYRDAEEKKQSRNKVLEFIDNNGVAAFTSNFITPLFADPNHPAIPKVRDIAMKASEQAVKGYTIAMRDRYDTTSVLKNFQRPVLFLAGEKDQVLSIDSIRHQAALPLHSRLNILPNVAHMGMFESENQCVEIISAFVKEKSVTN